MKHGKNCVLNMIKMLLINAYAKVFWWLNRPKKATAMPHVTLCKPPSEYTEYLKRNPTYRTFYVGVPMLLRPIDWYNICEVNDTINYGSKYKGSVHGKDCWSLEGSEGNCEYYAIKKRQLLLEGGIKRANLPLAVCVNEQGLPHVVLCITTTDGVYVLDNRFDEVLPWDKINYSSWKIELSTNKELLWSQVTN
jgi:predicted transglutaminase-like cysteine proteinase